MNIPYHDLESTLQHYVLGKLTEIEAEEFEAYYLSNPELIEMVEAAQTMQIGFANTPAESLDRVQPAKASLVQLLIKWLSVPVPAFAVIATAAVITPLALNYNGADKAAEQISLVNFSTSATRGLESIKLINLAHSSGTTAIMIKLKTVSHPYYKLRVFKSGQESPVWISSKFQVSALRDQLVVIPELAKISNATIDVVGIDEESKETVVEFCHYSEVCR